MRGPALMWIGSHAPSFLLPWSVTDTLRFSTHVELRAEGKATSPAAAARATGRSSSGQSRHVVRSNAANARSVGDTSTGGSVLAYGFAMEMRLMRPNEYGTVRKLCVSSFGDPSIGQLLDGLRASWAWDDALSFVACVAGELVGQALYTHAFLDTPSRLVDALVLSPVAVLPSRQRQGIGAALVKMSLEALSERPEPLVFVEGDSDYYQRLGFEQASGLGFEAPSARIPDSAFMAVRLPRYEQWMTGRLVYSDPFWRNDAVGPGRDG